MLAPVSHQCKHGTGTPAIVRDLIARLEEDVPAFSRIRCPQCAWQPSPADRWVCAAVTAPEHHAGCGTSWNTFSTRGRCPGCEHQWRWTSCLACRVWSRHEAWYDSEERLH